MHTWPFTEPADADTCMYVKFRPSTLGDPSIAEGGIGLVLADRSAYWLIRTPSGLQHKVAKSRCQTVSRKTAISHGRNGVPTQRTVVQERPQQIDPQFGFELPLF